ncbi:MAG: AmmeMemoRadiSam system protein A [Nannocystaceae bacterium]
MDRVSCPPPEPAVETSIGESARRWLLASAREALGRAMGAAVTPAGPAPPDPVLDQPRRLFVSWHEGAQLVGCIGTLQGDRPLREAVPHYAVQAGLHDPRTPRPTVEHFPHLHAEISILTEPEPMAERGLVEITRALVPGRDGLVLRDGPRRAVFLPVVWSSLPRPQDFVAALCRKAGIDAARRAPYVEGERFFAELFEE